MLRHPQILATPACYFVSMRQTYSAPAFAFLALTCCLTAQTKLPPTPEEYGQWETLVEPGGGGRGSVSTGLSPDGKWRAYGINRSNGSNELRVTSVAGGTTKTAAFGAQPAFSRFALGSLQHRLLGIPGRPHAQGQQARQNKLGLLNLDTGEQTTVDAIQSFAFSPTGAWLAMRHYPPEPAPGGAAAGGRAGAPGGGRGGAGRGGAANGADDNAPGATLIVRQLATGRDMTFGNVSEFAWQDQKNRGTLLALAISTTDKTGNGVQLFDSKAGTLRVLDSSAVHLQQSRLAQGQHRSRGTQIQSR